MRSAAAGTFTALTANTSLVAATADINAGTIDGGHIEKMFIEPGKSDNASDDPYGETTPENVLKYLIDTSKPEQLKSHSEYLQKKYPAPTFP